MDLDASPWGEIDDFRGGEFLAARVDRPSACIIVIKIYGCEAHDFACFLINKYWAAVCVIYITGLTVGYRRTPGPASPFASCKRSRKTS